MFNKFIFRIPQVKEATGMSRTSIYKQINQGLWTRQINLGARAVGWPANEVSSLVNARIAGLSDVQIKVLVIELEADRQKLLKTGEPTGKSLDPNEKAKSKVTLSDGTFSENLSAQKGVL